MTDAVDAWVAGVDVGCSSGQLLAAMKTFPGVRVVTVATDGTVYEPASGVFDVTVAPGQPVQAAVDACPADGCVLLLPGIHDGTLVLAADKVVHVFGRGQATLRTTFNPVASVAATSTLDGLIIRRDSGSPGGYAAIDAVWINGGRLRMQACNVTNNAIGSCVKIDGGADPILVACKCVRVIGLPASSLTFARIGLRPVGYGA